MKKNVLICFVAGLILVAFGIILPFVFPSGSSNVSSPAKPSTEDDSSSELESPPTPTSGISSDASNQVVANITDEISLDEFQLADYFYYQVGYVTHDNILYVAIYNSGTNPLTWQQVIVTGQRGGENYFSCSYLPSKQLESNDSVILKCDTNILLDQVSFGFAAY